jgi:hypothetical protein
MQTQPDRRQVAEKIEVFRGDEVPSGGRPWASLMPRVRAAERRRKPNVSSQLLVRRGLEP